MKKAPATRKYHQTEEERLHGVQRQAEEYLSLLKNEGRVKVKTLDEIRRFLRREGYVLNKPRRKKKGCQPDGPVQLELPFDEPQEED